MFRASGLRWAPHAWSLPSLWSTQSCTATGSTRWELPRKYPGTVLKISVTRRFRAHFVCSRHRPAVSPSVPFVLTLQDQDTNSQIATPLCVENSVDTLIDFLHTQAFVENQIEDSREHTHTPATSAAIAVPTFKRTDILLIVTHLSHSFDHHAASTFTIVFGTAIQKAFHRLP